MCGTAGTPLGDPIEVNALGQALSARGAGAGTGAEPCPVALASAKACFGHTEGTAGIHGAMLAVLGLQAAATPPIMHSRALNPYVASAFEEWRSRLTVQSLVPRQSSAWPATAATLSLLAGCSSFGMSGVNAHGLFSVPAAPPRASASAPDSLPWHRSRHWPVPTARNMMTAALWDRGSQTARQGKSTDRMTQTPFRSQFPWQLI